MREKYDGIGIFENVESAVGGAEDDPGGVGDGGDGVSGAVAWEKSEVAEGFRGYRNGHHRERRITTAVGALTVKQPRVSDIPPEAGKYRSHMIRPYRRRSEAVNRQTLPSSYYHITPD